MPEETLARSRGIRMNQGSSGSIRDGTGLMPLERTAEDSSIPGPGGGRPHRGEVNLSRPWRFPAGHPDVILCRRHARRGVHVPIEISLLRSDGTLYDRGTGVIRDLSYSGARLGDVVLSRGRLLAMQFDVRLRPALESPGGPDIAGRILRTFSPGRPGFGIEFLVPTSGVEERLLSIP
jgi:hypothetical protein